MMRGRHGLGMHGPHRMHHRPMRPLRHPLRRPWIGPRPLFGPPLMRPLFWRPYGLWWGWGMWLLLPLLGLGMFFLLVLLRLLV